MKLIAIIALSAILGASSNAQQVTAAAAADFAEALDEIAARFEAQSGAHVKRVYGASGNLYEQIQEGAPFDVFFAANTSYPQRLESAGYAFPGTYSAYAQGKIVLLLQAGTHVSLKQGLRALLDPAIKHIAIADPAHAPYGQAAIEALRSEGLYDAVAAKIVRGENISQAASFVLSGAADAGMVALSTVLARAGANFVWAEVPARDYQPIVQAAIVLRSSKNPELARRLETYVRSEEALGILKRHGFEAPASSAQR
jgi:molybdate transport system substrate-binding protein